MVSIIFLFCWDQPPQMNIIKLFLSFLSYLTQMNALSFRIMGEDFVTDVAKHDIMAALKKIKCIQNISHLCVVSLSEENEDSK